MIFIAGSVRYLNEVENQKAKDHYYHPQQGKSRLSRFFILVLYQAKLAKPKSR